MDASGTVSHLSDAAISRLPQCLCAMPRSASACFGTYFVRTQCTSSLWSFTPYGVHVTSVTLSAPCSITRDPTSSGHTTSESTIL